jgi:hypothetical protein
MGGNQLDDFIITLNEKEPLHGWTKSAHLLQFLLSHQYVWYKSIFVCLLYRLTFRYKMQDDIP